MFITIFLSSFASIWTLIEQHYLLQEQNEKFLQLINIKFAIVTFLLNPLMPVGNKKVTHI